MKLTFSRSLLLIMFLLPSCGKDGANARNHVDEDICPTGINFGIFTISQDGTSAKVEGEITDRSLKDFNCMIIRYPDIDQLNLVDVSGSDASVSDDNLTDSALELGRAVFQNDIDTYLMDNGSVASGGTDLLVSGRNISVGDNTEIGVHAWGGGWDGNDNGTASDIAYFPDHDHKELEPHTARSRVIPASPSPA